MANKKRKARWWASRGDGKMVRLFGELVRERAWTTTPHPTPLADFERLINGWADVVTNATTHPTPPADFNRIRDFMASHSVPFDDEPLPHGGGYELEPPPSLRMKTSMLSNEPPCRDG